MSLVDHFFVEHSHAEYGRGYFCTPDVIPQIEAIETENERLKALINRVLEWTPAFPVEASLLDDLADAVRSPSSAPAARQLPSGALSEDDIDLDGFQED